jgi:hypothetical protein
VGRIYISIRDQKPEAIIENRTVDGNFTSPSCSAHLTFQFDNDHRKIILYKTVFDNLIGFVFAKYDVVDREDSILALKLKSPLIYETRYSFYPHDQKLDEFIDKIKKICTDTFSNGFFPYENARYCVNNIVYFNNSSSLDPTSSILYFLLFSEEIW